MRRVLLLLLAPVPALAALRPEAVDRLLEKDKAAEAWQKCEEEGSIPTGTDQQPLREACARAGWTVLLASDPSVTETRRFYSLWSDTEAGTEALERYLRYVLDTSKDPAELESLAKEYRTSALAETLRDRARNLALERARREGTLEALRAFQTRYADTPQAETAREAELDLAFAQAMRADSETSWERLLHDYPEHPEAERARGLQLEAAWRDAKTPAARLGVAMRYPDDPRSGPTRLEVLPQVVRIEAAVGLTPVGTLAAGADDVVLPSDVDTFRLVAPREAGPVEAALVVVGDVEEPLAARFPSFMAGLPEGRVADVWVDGRAVIEGGLCQPEAQTFGVRVRTVGWEGLLPFRVDRACRTTPLPAPAALDPWLEEMRPACNGPSARADELVWSCKGGEIVVPWSGEAAYFRVTATPRPARLGKTPSRVALDRFDTRAVPAAELRLTPGGGYPQLPEACPARPLPSGAKAAEPEGLPGVAEALEALRWAWPEWSWDVQAMTGGEFVPGGGPEVMVAVRQPESAPGGWEDALTLLADVHLGEVRLRYVDIRIRYRMADARFVPYTFKGQPYVRVDGWDQGDLYYCQSLHLRWDGRRLVLQGFE